MRCLDLLVLCYYPYVVKDNACMNELMKKLDVTYDSCLKLMDAFLMAMSFEGPEVIKMLKRINL